MALETARVWVGMLDLLAYPDSGPDWRLLKVTRDKGVATRAEPDRDGGS